MGERMKKRALFAPFTILKVDKLYFVWLVAVVIFSIPDLFNAILQGNISYIVTSISEGHFYTFSAAFCAPFIITMFIQIVTTIRCGYKSHFVVYKIICGIVAFVFVSAASSVLGGAFKGSLIGQLIFVILSIVLSFYMFCIGEMEKSPDRFKDYDDSDYRSIEERDIKDLQSKATHIRVSDGGVKL